MDVQNWQTQAADMVERQIRSRGIRDPGVLHAMESVPRHEFVAAAERVHAYEDHPIPIGLGQTISQPYIVAYMTELLQVTADDRVLEVGTGSGYQTAVLAFLAREVYTTEILEDLLIAAEARLRRMGFHNVRYAVRNGFFGWPDFAPFSRIIVTAGAATIPQPLIDQLGLKGRMVIPVGPVHEDQMLQVVVKTSPSSVEIEDKGPVRFVPLIG